MGRSGGSRTYHRKRASHHSCAPSSVPFTVDGCTVSQAPVFVARRRRCVPWTGAAAMVKVRASSDRCALRFRTTVRPSWRQAKWSAVYNPTWPLRAMTRCPVMTQDAVQFSGAVSVGSGRPSPAFFTDRRVTPLYGYPSHNLSKICDKKVSRSAFSTRLKASPMSGATFCTNAHS